MSVEPVPGEAGAIVDTGQRRLLLIADFHAGIESVLRADGVELDSRAGSRRERLCGLLAETGAEELVVLGDLVHSIGEPWESERAELTALFDSIEVPVTLVKGNHDGEIEPFLDELDHDISVTHPTGTRFGSVGCLHGHTWPGEEILDVDILCMGHEHPLVRLEDTVGAARIEQVWIRGALASAPFETEFENHPPIDGELVVFPAFNDISGGTQVNVEEQAYLSPFLPSGLDSGQAYLLDGTRLGPIDNL